VEEITYFTLAGSRKWIVESPPLVRKILGDAVMTGAFQKWVTDSGGPAVVAKKLRVSIHSIKFWHARKGSPRVGTIIKLVQLSKGKLTYASVIDSTQPKGRK
jgi:hypothetical protein